MTRKVFRRALGIVDRDILRHLPPRVFGRLRITLLRVAGADICASVTIGPGVRVIEPEGLVMRSGSSVARDAVLDARGGLTLRENCLIGFESVLLTSTHNATHVGVPIQKQGMFAQPIVVGERAWLGARVFVLPGCDIAEDAIVATSSVVTRHIPARTIAAGIPARNLKKRA